jgi:cell division transport system ATP-binding protein
LLQDHTIAQNLFLVLKATGWEKNAAEKRIDEVLIEVGLIHTKDKMPTQLSGGEQQKIVVARALLNNPPIILADEPTGNLDPETANEIMQLLLRINREHNTVVVMATHFYHIIAKYPSRILKCEASSITEQSGLVVS